MKAKIAVLSSNIGNNVASIVGGTYAEIPSVLASVEPAVLIQFASSVAKCCFAQISNRKFEGVEYTLSTRE